MTTLVHFVPLDRDLDLAEPLTEIEYRAVISWHGKIKRGDDRTHVLRCHMNGAPLYLKVVGGRYYGAHFSGEMCDVSHAITGMSDEHRRQTDYFERSATDIGLATKREHSTGGGTILDLAIHGPTPTGIEVQRYAMTIPAAKARTTKSKKAGWLPIWFTAAERQPAWAYRVPTIGTTLKTDWKTVPARRAAIATGITNVVARRCRAGEFDYCPVTGRRPFCGKWHPAREPRFGLTVDDVAQQTPYGQILPVQPYPTKDDVWLITPEGMKLYAELGGLGRTSFDPSRVAPQSGWELDGNSRECSNPHQVDAAPSSAVTAETLMVGEVPCRLCGLGINLAHGRDTHWDCERNAVASR